tara:strand:+ start:3542 stop:3943 length:402 start_codon:yes stop_codon:yes gene_type:complete
MPYQDEVRNRSHYDNSKYDLSQDGEQLYNVGRDDYDNDMNTRDNMFRNRHASQISQAQNVEHDDKTWVKHKDAVRQLNLNIRQRTDNYNTYKKALEAEQVLYNRERHKTLLLSVANVFALTGCIFMWTSAVSS